MSKPFTLEEIFASDAFDDRPLQSPRWMRDGRRLSYLALWPGSERNTVWVMDGDTGERRPLFDPATLTLLGSDEPLTMHQVQWSPDEQWLLMTENAPARFTPCGDLFLVSAQGGPARRLTRSSAPQHHPKLSPDGQRVGFVRGGDLWTLDLPDGQERRLTHDGSDTVYNGRTGWVYEEELALADGWTWSPDGARIAWLRQDEADVPVTLLPDYDDPHAAPITTRYPKAGDPNPRVSLHLLHVETGERMAARIEPEDGGEFYVAQMQWTREGGLLIQRIPRRQERLDLLSIDAESGAARIVMTERDTAWVEPWSWLHFVEGSTQFLWPSERDGWRHLYLYDLSGECLRQVTRGPWEVTEVAGLNSADRSVTFVAARPTLADRSVWRVSLDGGEPEPVGETRPGWTRGWTSPSGTRMVEWRSSPTDPPRAVLRGTEDRIVATLAESPPEMLAGRVLLPWESLTISTPAGALPARLLKPPGFDPGSRYPVLMHVYGGPGSQVVTNSWGGKSGLWYQMLAREGFMVCQVDNRGTGGRGREFKKAVHLRLGQLEAEDQIAAARHLAGLPFVDAERIGIWGWSYGGTLAALCLFLGADVFRTGAAVAPVADWRLYDTIYTERFMRRPDENPEGYEKGSPVTHAEKLRGAFLLVHGLMDDNVHFQNAARLASALQDAGRPFEMMVYPGKRHGIEDRHAHLYRHLTEFFQKQLKPV